MILEGNRGLYCSKADCQTLLVPGTEITRIAYGEYSHVNCPSNVPFKRSTKTYDTKVKSLDADFE